jgi:hypothetical protein
MTKKSRRTRRQRTARRSTTPTPPEVTPEAQFGDTPGKAEPAAAPAPRKQVDFRAEYGYVIDDLRSMAIIAVAMLAVLIGLAVFIG